MLSSSRFSVDLPASGAQSRRFACNLPASTAITGSWRSVSCVDQILVAQRNAEHPLAHQGAQLMFDQRPIAVIHEAGGQAIDQPDRPIGGAKQQRASVRGHRPAIERGDHGTVLDRCKTEQIRVTVCGHRGVPPVRDKPLLHKALSQIRSPDAATV